MKNQEPVQQQQPEAEDKTITLVDYLSKSAVPESKQQINDVKANITEEELQKELGKATLLKRKEDHVDDHNATHKHYKGATVVGMSTEHADLLGFRTGFIPKDFTRKYQPKDGDEKPAEKEGKTYTFTARLTEQRKEDQQEDKRPQDDYDDSKGIVRDDSKGIVRDDKGYRGGYRGGKREGYHRGSYDHEENGKQIYGYKGKSRGEYRGGYKGESWGGYKGEGRGGNKSGNHAGYHQGYKEAKKVKAYDSISLI